jgi:hypothetical protein
LNNSDSGGTRLTQRIRTRVSWSMQLIAVLGSLTAGEMARSAISTIWMTPNSTSCCKRAHRTDIESSGQFDGTVAVQPAPAGHHQQRHALWHEMAHRAGDAHAQMVRPGELNQPLVSMKRM